MRSQLFAALLPVFAATVLIGIPLLGQFLPQRFRDSVLTPRTRTLMTSLFMAFMGVWIAGLHTSSLSIWLGGVLFGVGVCQALAAIDIRLLLGRRLDS